MKTHHLVLHEGLEFALRQNAVKMIERGTKHALTRGGVAKKDCHGAVADPRRHHLQRRGVQLLLALKVVVEQRLVDACGLGDLLGARAGEAVGGKLAECGVEDAAAGLSGALGLGFGMGGWGHSR